MYHEQKESYRGKHFTVPVFSREGGVAFTPTLAQDHSGFDRNKSALLQDIGKPFDLAHFARPRRPVSLGFIPVAERTGFVKPVPRVLDLPIKMAGNGEYRIPKELTQFADVIRRMAEYEMRANPRWHDYYAYLTIDQAMVRPNVQLREAPCHVDGFQGDRWNPKHPGNHTYTVANTLPTWFYPMPFDFKGFDTKKLDIFWEMNYQVAQANSAIRWSPEDWEITLMDCYCVHRGREASVPTNRTWIRLSFETRIFDRLGNGHNPLFDYHWDMIPRDIEELGLTALHTDSDPSLRVFPWQALDGSPLPEHAPKTKPNLMPLGPGVIPPKWRDYEMP